MSTYSSQPTAPGREGAPPPTTTTGTAPADGGAQGPPSPFGGSGMMVLAMALPILLLVMTTRGNTKKQKQIESSLKVSDVVITQSGIIGKITELVGDTRVKVEIAPGVSIRMLKSAISGIDGGEPKPTDAKEKPQEKKA